ncbi:membrane protein [Anopheles sinensis]|uniref:Membrane protein n=1 Tax=Anopheles sinensis TaxID=74873 RepID=A0A084VR44_ANOSI|nr:membrane protein [Anopheles sinensis]
MYSDPIQPGNIFFGAHSLATGGVLLLNTTHRPPTSTLGWKDPPPWNRVHVHDRKSQQDTAYGACRAIDVRSP